MCEKCKKPKLTPEDLDLWQDLMGDVEPLSKKQAPKPKKHEQKQTTVYDSNAQVPPLPEDIDKFEDFINEKITLDELTPSSPKTLSLPFVHPQDVFVNIERTTAKPNIETNAFFIAENTAVKLAGWRQGTDKKTIQHLAKGKFTPTLDLDLHGLTLLNAYAEVRVFLAEAVADGHKCVLIIHGKGRRDGREMGAIKENLAVFLSERTEVLAFHTAAIKHGGTGACYVLLRRPK